MPLTNPGPSGPTSSLGIRTLAPAEALELASADSPNGTARLLLGTYEETSGSDYNEVLRIAALKIGAKPCIAFLPDPADSHSKVWLQAHKYLHNYAALTLAPADVNVGTDTLTVAGNNYVTGLSARFTTTGALPAPLALATDYWLRVTAGAVTLHPTKADAAANTNKIDLTTQGTGVHTITPDQASFNNLHKHFSIEVTDSTGTAKQTRLSIPYDYDLAQIGFFSSDVNVNAGKVRINDAAGVVKELQFGNTLSDNLAPDLTNLRWSVRQDGTAEGGANAGSDFRIVRWTDAGAAIDAPFFIKRSTGNVGLKTLAPTVDLEIGSTTTTNAQMRLVRSATTGTCSVLFTTNATDNWLLGSRNDSTTDLHIRDSANGKSLLVFKQAQGGQVVFGAGTRFNRVVVADTAYTHLGSDYFIAYSSTTAARAVNLLPAATAGAGAVVIVKDEGGTAGTFNINVTPNGAEKIDNVAALKAINTNFGVLRLYSNGANWFTY